MKCGHERDVTMIRNGVVLVRSELFGKVVAKDVMEAIAKLENKLDQELYLLEKWECIPCEMGEEVYLNSLFED